MELRSNRLQSVANLLNKNMKVADIGADHGDLSIYLAQKGFERIIATEAKKGPYKRLVSNIEKENLTNKIETIFADGLNSLPNDIDTICILGMGGMTINYILRSNIDIAKRLKNIIIEPQSEEENVRKFLLENNFEITYEEYVKESNKHYPIIACHFTEQDFDKDYSFGDLLYGKYGVKNKDPNLLEKITKDYEYLLTLPNIVLKKEEKKLQKEYCEKTLKNWFN